MGRCMGVDFTVAELAQSLERLTAERKVVASRGLRRGLRREGGVLK